MNPNRCQPLSLTLLKDLLNLQALTGIPIGFETYIVNITIQIIIFTKQFFTGSSNEKYSFCFVHAAVPFICPTGRLHKKKAGAKPVIIVDSVKLTHEQFMAFDPTTIARVTVLTDTDATNRYGPDAKDGVVLAESKAFARKHYIAFHAENHVLTTALCC